MSNQTRIIIATVLSFLFFASYDYFFIPKTDTSQQNSQQQTQKQVSTDAPKDVSTNAVSSTPAKLPAQTPSVTKAEEIIATIDAKTYKAQIDKFGRISKFYLKEKKYLMPDGQHMQLIDSKLIPHPLEMRFSDVSINEQAFKVPYTSSTSTATVTDKEGSKVVLTQKLDGLTITKTLTFFAAGNYDIKIHLSKPAKYFITPGLRPNQAADGYTFHGALIKEADDTHTAIADGDAQNAEQFKGAKIAAGADRYYTTALYNLDKGFDVIEESVGGEEEMPLLFIKGNGNLDMSGYIGPKEYKELYLIDPRLTDIIEYGFFTFISKPLFLLLSYLHSLFGNWGWAIVALTFLIRLVLFPLTYKGMLSMNKLKELSPKIKELQAKYKGDSQKLNAHMMELYKKHGANPMGGCLPIILQIPVFFAIYRVLQNAIELKAAPWILWIHDLSVMDPYFVLPIAMGITMFFHQRLTPTNFTDPTQEKIMKFLPLIFTFFFVTFPAGLTLYWFVNNIFSIIQEAYVNSLFAKKKEQKAEK